MLKKYCAIIESESDYLLAALKIKGAIAYVENMALGSLTLLAETYRDYPLALAIDEAYLLSQTWFFPSQKSSVEIYQQLSKKFSGFYLDFEKLKEESGEQLIVSYALKKEDAEILQKPYRERGFHISALEPLPLLQKKSFQQAWQTNAMTQYSFQEDQQALTLKLLDRENFYGD